MGPRQEEMATHGVRETQGLLRDGFQEYAQKERLPVRMLYDFRGEDVGAEYMSCRANEILTKLSVPPSCEPDENWTLVLNAEGKGGWVPTLFLATMGPPVRAPPP